MPQLIFSIAYDTRWGEHLHVDFQLPGETPRSLAMATTDGHRWQAALDIPAGTGSLSYAYRLCADDGRTLRAEQPLCRTLELQRQPRLLLSDSWTERPLDDLLLRSAFSRCVYRPEAVPEPADAPFRLVLQAPPPPAGHRWAVSGSSASLGAWAPDGIRMLSRTGTYEWTLPLTAADFRQGAEYKYVLAGESDTHAPTWETGPNRRLEPQPTDGMAGAVHRDDSPRISLPQWRGAGVVMPVFSLRSRESFGIGDFGDLIRLISWAARTGLRAVQLLPVNDTTATGTWRDSYPYSGISVFALHPLYIDAAEWRDTDAYARHAAQGHALNDAPELDYEAVSRVKTAFLRDLFEEKRAVLRTKAYREFVSRNARWLRPYALFCHLRDKYHTADFRRWPLLADYDAAAADALLRHDAEARRATDYHQFVQFLLARQMERVHAHARRCGVILKGDIPIGICRDSVPAWVDRHLFHFDGQAGAPPDDFARHGQNWGFPTYDWDVMARDGYAWWRERLATMGRYFDAYRIDHVLGFFRIWEIPRSQTYGLLGRFRPALPLSDSEVAASGFTLSPSALSRPLLTEERLEELSDALGGRGLKRFFRPVADASGLPAAPGRRWWTLCPEADTQRKILALVPEGPLRTTLLDAVAEVLFIADGADAALHHPRVAAQQTRLFALLSEPDRQAFNRLYDDFFYVRHNSFWAAGALPKLRALLAPAADGSEALLPCAEDLGMVPASVKGVLEELRILSLEIQRMPKRYGVRFDNPAHNPYLSVATIATHDMPPLRLWWTESAEQRQAFWQQALGHTGEAPAEATPAVCEEVVTRHLASPSMLCLLALQDLLAMDATLRHPDPAAEQINVPAVPDHYWRYRMHLTLEQLDAATAFNEKLRGLVERSGR